MGKTVAEKILGHHADHEVKAGTTFRKDQLQAYLNSTLKENNQSAVRDKIKVDLL